MRVVMDPAVRPATAWSSEGPKRVGREVAIVARERLVWDEKAERGEGKEERERERDEKEAR